MWLTLWHVAESCGLPCVMWLSHVAYLVAYGSVMWLTLWHVHSLLHRAPRLEVGCAVVGQGLQGGLEVLGMARQPTLLGHQFHQLRVGPVRHAQQCQHLKAGQLILCHTYNNPQMMSRQRTEPLRCRATFCCVDIPDQSLESFDMQNLGKNMVIYSAYCSCTSQME